MAEQHQLTIGGMDCSNCALSITRYLQKQGMEKVKVNFATGQASFVAEAPLNEDLLRKGIAQLGYEVKQLNADNHSADAQDHDHHSMGWPFVVCLLLTLPLLAHMIPGLHWHWLMNPYVQLGLSLPVYGIGLWKLGRSALTTALAGVPNMNVLIVLGATAAMGYSLYGTFLTNRAEDFLFYETAATIITLVFFGNWLEDRAVATTQAALEKLKVKEELKATMLVYNAGEAEQQFEVDASTLQSGDLILIKTGETVPADAKILSGEVQANESLLTGESAPVVHGPGSHLTGGSVVVEGNAKAYVTAVGKASVLGQIRQMITDAQAEKPPVQLLADRISAVFVPVVLAIGLLTFLINYAVGISATDSLMRAIAVLVIACPCAMGLATPAAIAVGLGRAAGKGILFRNAERLEVFRTIERVVFDKTGTLTTGKFEVERLIHNSKVGSSKAVALDAAHLANHRVHELGTEGGTEERHSPLSHMDEASIRQILYSLERVGVHPIARAVAAAYKEAGAYPLRKVKELKGLGMEGFDAQGRRWLAGSFVAVGSPADLPADAQVYLACEGQVVAWVYLNDALRPEAAEVVARLQAQGLEVVLLSGDSEERCAAVAKTLGITQVLARQTPAQKLEQIARLAAEKPTAMVGDGINDAPALAKATVGISLAEASQLAMQSAGVVLVKRGIALLPEALGLGRHTYRTIQQNLFWALAYNVVAIPVAALGFLSPTVGALVMGLSDVVLAGNSVRLRWKKVG